MVSTLATGEGTAEPKTPFSHISSSSTEITLDILKNIVVLMSLAATSAIHE